MHRSHHFSRSLLPFALIAVIVLLPLFTPAPVASANEPVLVKSFQKAYDVNWRDSVVINGVFFFIADDGIHGAELWRSDGTPDGTRLVKDIRPGAAGADLSWFHVVGDVLFFVANDGVHGHELWRSDGTTEGTFMVKDIRAGSQGSLPWVSYSDAPMLVSGETIFFVADDDVHGRELWRSDGTPDGTRLVKDIRPGSESAFVTSYDIQLVAMNGVLYFFTLSTDTFSYEMWRSDGTTEGTFLLRSFNVWGRLIVHENTLFIATPYGLWKSDGTPAGTVVIRSDICVSVYNPAHFAVMGDALFFVGNFIDHQSAFPGMCKYELMRSDGTPEGTFLVKSISRDEWFGSGSLDYYTFLTVVGDTLFFQANDYIHGRELWKSDGSAEGTVMLKDIYPGRTSSLSPVPFTVMGRTIFFVANNDVSGSELWRSDGTTEGTTMVMDIHPGWPSSLNYWDLTSLHSSLFFNVNEVPVVPLPGGFWRSDGTAGGTVQVLPELAYARAAICGQAFITSQTSLYVLLLDANRCTISGRVTDNAGRGVAGATVQAGDRSTTTDADGFYTLSGLPTGTYTLTATLNGYQITPVSRTVTVSSDVSGQDFNATPITYRISGRVTDNAGRGVAGATVRAGERSAATDVDGFYTLSGLPTGTYTLTATLSGYQITPVSRTVTVSSDVSGQDFSATPLTYRISGRVTDSAGRGVAGATVQAGERSAATDANGFYTLSDLPAGDYTLTVSKSGCTIAPPQRTVTVPPDGVNQDFNAVCLTERVVLPLIVR